MAAKRPSAVVAPVAQTVGVQLQALRKAAADGVVLSTAELAQLAGRSAVGIGRLRSGHRLHGFRVRRVACAEAEQGVVWQLVATSGPRQPGDPARLAGR